MPFPLHERVRMKALRGVGDTVIDRLEAIGFTALAELRGALADEVVQQIAGSMRSTCWRNSPQARAAIQAIVDLADGFSHP